jgi:hypothetical protein
MPKFGSELAVFGAVRETSWSVVSGTFLEFGLVGGPDACSGVRSLIFVTSLVHDLPDS